MSQKTGRNEPCPCGSGKKYKRCCLPRDEVERRELSQQKLWGDDDTVEDPDWIDDDVPAPPSADEIVKVRHSRGTVKSFDLEQVVKAHRQQGGTCQLCGAELRRNSAIRHLADCAPAHDVRTGAGFGSRRLQRTMNARLRDALSGSGGRFKYEYDFGSTTTLQLEVKGERTGRLGRAATRQLARNTPLVWPCASCGEPASVVCAACIDESANPFVCKKHSRGRHACGESEAFLPVVNSPRMGICGYAG